MSRVFDGSVANSLAVDMGLASSTTEGAIGAWIKKSSFPNNNEMYVNVGIGGNGRRWAGQYNVGGVPWGFGQSTSADIQGSTEFLTDTWQLIVLTKEGGDWKLYIDATEIGSVTDSNNFLPGGGDFRLGSTTSDTGPMDGKLAHAFVLTRGLTSAEVSNLAGGASPNDLDSTGRLAYYPMTDSSLANEWNADSGVAALSETGTVAVDGADNPALSSPSSTTIDTTPATAYPGQSRTLAVTNAGATQGTGGVTIGGVAQTITAWSDTSITFTTVLGANSYGTGKTVELTTDSGETDTGTIELIADTASGFGAVTMDSPNTTDTSSVAYDTTPTVVTGDQFEWEDFNSLGNLTIDAQGFVSNVDTEGTFRGRFWDATDSTWGTVENFTAEVPDETAPTISSASVPTAGDNIAVQMDEAMQVGAGGTGGWTISLGDASVSAAAVDGVDATVINLTPSRTLTTEDTLTIGYTQPGDGFQDQAETPNDLATLSGQTVTNNSTQDPPDVTGPVTTSVNVPFADSYGIGETISFTVNWDEAATVTGTPRLPVNLTAGTVYADYASGTGTTALVFSYTIQEGDNDADGITLGAIDLNGGTIQDGSGNNATLTLNGVENTAGVIVDGVRPVITPVGENPYTLVVGGTYTDQGANATDNQDGALAPVTGTGSVDEQTIGQYTITYPGAGVVDSAGNVAEDATRIVNVVDELPVDIPSARAIGFRDSIRTAVRDSVSTSIH